MKSLEEYEIPIHKRNDFLEYKKIHPEITASEYIKKGLAHTIAEYDYKSIVFDFWKTGFYSGKLDLVGAIMQWSKGKLNPRTILETFEKGVNNENKN